jgi:hypothetical protein
LAQVALSYSYNFNDQTIYDDVCILSVLAQCAIDNAKRKFDIDITEEIALIKQSMQIDIRKYPKFWLVIRPGFKRDNINSDLKCPMNYIFDIELPSYTPKERNIPIGNFFVNHELNETHRISRRVEKLIERYSLKQLMYNSIDATDHTLYLLKQNDFEQLIDDIRSIYKLPDRYVGMISKLINRAFCITHGIRTKIDYIDSKTKKNRSILLKVLYNVNKEAFLQCFLGK